MSTSWSPQQAQALDKVMEWLKSKPRSPVFHLFGFAGSGKTTLAIEIRNRAAELLLEQRREARERSESGLREAIPTLVMFAAFTGKAALVMRGKGCSGARTIHSLIYTNTAEPHMEPKWEVNEGSDLSMAGLLIVDECSMLDANMGRDLLSFEVPILVLGDPFQLPPIMGAGFFDTHSPEVMLTDIHRQAQDNPIIRMSMDIREGKRLKQGKYGESQVMLRAAIPKEAVTEAGQVIVGKNDTRQVYNATMRKLLMFDSQIPMQGEKLICLKNNRKLGIFNGGMWTVTDSEDRVLTKNCVWLDLESQDIEDKEIDVEVPIDFFLGKEQEIPREYRARHPEFTYGYAITCHKSQGSQWPSVVVFDESRSFREHAQRWLYTAITRASEKVVVCL